MLINDAALCGGVKLGETLKGVSHVLPTPSQISDGKKIIQTHSNKQQSSMPQIADLNINI